MTSPPIAGRRVFGGVAAVCFANLLLEVTLTRIFSATMYYHFTFLAIALALFGLGAAGVYVYVRADRFPPEAVAGQLSAYSSKFAVTSILCVVYVLANPMDILIVTGTSQTPMFTTRTLWQLLLLNGVSALPFFYAGMVVALAVAQYQKQIDRLYSWDLAGAAAAAVLVGPLLGLLGAPSLVLAVAVLAMVGAALFRTPRGLQWTGIVLAVGGLLTNLVTDVVAVPTTKGVKAERKIFEKWNVFSRITVDDKLEIKIDASAATTITSLDTVNRVNIKREISTLAYSMFDGAPEHAFIIGPGGGRDVVHALAAGTKSITAVEVNPIIVHDIMKDRFAEESGRLYLDSRVNVIADEGRSFIRRSKDKFDVIQASLVDTWAATAAGAFALTENTLYTVEAFEDYFAHLTDRGAITMTRWHTGESGETARLLIVTAAALERRGVSPGDARKHIYYAFNDSLGTLIAKSQPFTNDELDRLDATARDARFRVEVSPRTPGGTLLELFVDSGSSSPLVRNQREDLTAPTDDRPFFFYPIKGSRLFSSLQLGGRVSLNNPALWIVVSFFAVGLLTLSFILIPLYRKRDALRGGIVKPRERISALVYFGLIGVGFITVEIALLQKLTFFLGHPSNALLVVLFSILLGTSIGARLSGRVPESKRRNAVLAAAGGVAFSTLLFAIVVAPSLRAWVAWPWVGRVLVSGAMVLVFGTLMGFLLPLGVRRVAERMPELVPWGWGINGALSVMGTVAATAVAIHEGFTMTLLIGGGFYLLVPLAYRLVAPPGASDVK